MSCKCCKSENRTLPVNMLYRAKIYQTFFSGEKSLELCRNHDIELFRLGERKFFIKYKRFFEYLKKESLNKNYGDGSSGDINFKLGA